MLFIQIANIINELVQLDPDIKYYHYGLPEDVNRNIPNNFDPTSDTGRKFPYVLQIPRQLTARAQQNGTQSLFETHTVELLFITQLKIFSKLQVLAERIIKGLIEYAEEQALPPFNISDYTIDPDAARFTANTRMIRVNLSLVFPSACSEYDYDLSILAVDPNDTVTTDLEDVNDNTPIVQP
jgi:hypothetical protein